MSAPSMGAWLCWLQENRLLGNGEEFMTSMRTLLTVHFNSIEFEGIKLSDHFAGVGKMVRKHLCQQVELQGFKRRLAQDEQ